MDDEPTEHSTRTTQQEQTAAPSEQDGSSALQQRSNVRHNSTAFPPELAWVTDQDRNDFTHGLEVDTNQKSKNYHGQENLVAQTVKVTVNFCDIIVNLKVLTVSHLRQLCKNLGIMNCGSLSKYKIRRAIATY
jgi:hypothetical protein